MRKRSKAREYALQMLYQVDITHMEPPQAIETFWTYHHVSPDVRQFADRLVRGTLDHQKSIDEMIAARANNWDIARMAVVDRNILRMGVFELLHVEDVPPKVCLNEAVELAKRFGDEESSRFVNGILDSIHKQCVSRPDAVNTDGADGNDANGSDADEEDAAVDDADDAEDEDESNAGPADPPVLSA